VGCPRSHDLFGDPAASRAIKAANCSSRSHAIGLSEDIEAYTFARSLHFACVRKEFVTRIVDHKVFQDHVSQFGPDYRLDSNIAGHEKEPPLSTSVLAEAVHAHECVVANPQGNEFGLEAVPKLGRGDDGDQFEFLGRAACRHQSISDWACDRDIDVTISLLFVKSAQKVERKAV